MQRRLMPLLGLVALLATLPAEAAKCPAAL
jgi:hypothetical protein